MPSPKVTVIEIEIGQPDPITKYDAPVAVPVTVRNVSPDPISGEIVIGGPTSGIYPLANPLQVFSLEPGASFTTTFPVAFDTTCLNGWYPIHAFVSLTSGRDLREQAVGILRTEFADADPWAGEAPSVTAFEPAPKTNPIREVLKGQRIAALADFIRETPALDSKQAFRLGSGQDAFALLTLPGQNGLFDGIFSLIGPSTELQFRGLKLDLETPSGVGETEPLVVDGFEVDPLDDGLDVTHQIRIGDFWTEVVVQIRTLENGLKLRALSPDRISSFGLGPADQKPVALTAGLGFRFEELGDWVLNSDSPLLAVSHVGFDFSNGLKLVQASTAPLKTIEVSPDERLGRITLPGSDWLYLIPSEESVFEAAAGFRGYEERSTGLGVRNLAGRHWIDVSTPHFGDLADRILELRRYGVTKSALLVRNWQKYNPNSRFPDIWPPNEALGSLMELQIVAKHCRESEMLWGLEDAYGFIDPRASEFSYDAVAFQADGAPKTEGAAGTETLKFSFRPDRIEPHLAHNLKRIRYYLTPTLASVKGAESGLDEFFDRDGKRFPAARAQEAWKKTMAYVQNYLGPNSASVTQGGGDWLLGTTDGAGFEVRETDFPGSFRRVPWFSIVHHERLPIYELRPEKDPGDPLILLTEAMGGRLPVTDDRCWGHAMVRKDWLMQPIVEALAHDHIERVSMLQANPGRIRCLWGKNGLVWINGSDEAWEVSDRVIAPNGFFVRAEDVEASIELRDGVVCEQVISPITRYANARPRHWSMLRIRPQLKEVRVNAGQASVVLDWNCEETFPHDVKLMVQVSDPEAPHTIWSEAIIEPAEAPTNWIGALETETPLELAGIPGVRASLSVVAIAPNGRPLRLLGESMTAGRYAGMATTIGQISLGFGGGGQFSSAEVIPTKPIALETLSLINESLKPVDFGWTTTNGAFRLTQGRDGLVVTPLPDCPPFELSLDLEALLIEPDQVQGVVSREVFTAKWQLQAPILDENELTIRHDPRNFSYTILLAPPESS